MSFEKHHSLHSNAISVVEREAYSPDRDDLQQIHARSITPIRGLGTICIPLDGTPYAEHAIPLGLSLSKRSGGVLKLVRVFVPSPTPFRHRQWDAFDITEDRLRIDALHYLDRLQEQISANAPEINVATQLASASKVINGIREGARRTDLVVMSSRSKGWLGRLIFGSVSSDVLHHRKGPTIFVRGSESPADLSMDVAPTHISIALDGNDENDRIFVAVGMLAQLYNSNVSLVHAPTPHDSGMRAGNVSAGTYLDRNRKRFAKYVPDTRAYIAGEPSRPTEGILSFVKRSGTDLLAVAARGRQTRSVQNVMRLIQESPVPVLVVHES